MWTGHKQSRWHRSDHKDRRSYKTQLILQLVMFHYFLGSRFYEAKEVGLSLFCFFFIKILLFIKIVFGLIYLVVEVFIGIKIVHIFY